MVLFKFVLIIYHTVIEKSKKWMQVIFKEINEKTRIEGIKMDIIVRLIFGYFIIVPASIILGIIVRKEIAEKKLRNCWKWS